MRPLYRIIFLIAICYNPSPILAQKKIIDSLSARLKVTLNDTDKINTMVSLGWSLKYINPDSAIALNTMALHLCENVKLSDGKAPIGRWDKGIADACRGMGIFYDMKGDYHQAQKLEKQALEISERLKDKKSVAATLGHLGVISQQLGDYPSAMDYYFKSLKIAEEVKVKVIIATALNNIGLAYWELGDGPKALEYDFRTLHMNEEMGNKNGIANVLANIGSVYKGLGKYKDAMEYYAMTLKVAEELGNKYLIAMELGNIGNAYMDQVDSALEKGNKEFALKEKFPQALDYDMRSLQLNERMGNKLEVALRLSNIGLLYTYAGKYKEAEDYLNRARKLNDSIGALGNIRDNEAALSNLYFKTGKYEQALEHYKKGINARDSLFNQENAKKNLRTTMQYDFDKKEAVVSAEHKVELDKQKAMAEEKSRKQVIIIWAVGGGLLLLVVFSGFIYNRFRITRKQKRIIEKQKEVVEKQKQLVETQKEIVEEKNREITDSINYAKRLQQAILPPERAISEEFLGHFLLYRPKDIVAGDFYWMISSPNRDETIIAAADCTGHGVPGALVSVVCSNALHRAVKEFKIADPGQILDKVRELVIETFEKSTSDVKDGMDISLASINRRKGTLSWAGANNPLWYTQKGVMMEIKADKQAIGKTDDPKLFTTHSLKIQEGESIYLFTDGYADQFGGPKGKKFKYKAFQETLLQTASLPANDIKVKLEETFDEWKGSLEQVDDVCVIGIRL